MVNADDDVVISPPLTLPFKCNNKGRAKGTEFSLSVECLADDCKRALSWLQCTGGEARFTEWFPLQSLRDSVLTAQK